MRAVTFKVKHKTYFCLALAILHVFSFYCNKLYVLICTMLNILFVNTISNLIVFLVHDTFSMLLCNLLFRAILNMLGKSDEKEDNVDILLCM